MNLQTPNPLLQQPLIDTLTPDELAHYMELEHGPQHPSVKAIHSSQQKIECLRGEIDEKEHEVDGIQYELNDAREDHLKTEKELDTLQQAICDALDDSDSDDDKRFAQVRQLIEYDPKAA